MTDALSMKPRDARLVLKEAEQWHRDGLLQDHQWEKIRAHYRQTAASKEGDSDVATVLQVAAGAVIAAAVILLAVVSDFNESNTFLFWWLVGMLATGLGTVGAFQKWSAVAEASLGAGVVLLAAAGVMFIGLGDDPVRHLAWVALALPVLYGLPGLRGAPTMIALAAAVAPAFLFFEVAGGLDDGALLWLGYNVAHLILLVTMAALLKQQERDTPVATTTLAMGVSTVVFLFAQDVSAFDGWIEIVVGMEMLLALALGFLVRNRGLMVGAAAFLVGDAIAFAFHIGGLAVGITVLVITALVLLLLGTMAGRLPWLSQDASE